MSQDLNVAEAIRATAELRSRQRVQLNMTVAKLGVPAATTQARAPDNQVLIFPGDVESAFYEDDVRRCNICTESFRAGDCVRRLLCRQMFHADCWEDLSTKADETRKGSLPELSWCRVILGSLATYRPCGNQTYGI